MPSPQQEAIRACQKNGPLFLRSRTNVPVRQPLRRTSPDKLRMPHCGGRYTAFKFWRVLMRVTASATTTVLVIVLAACGGAQQPAFDVLITGGDVLDGTGAPAVRADVGIRGDRVVEVGSLAGRAAT